LDSEECCDFNVQENRRPNPISGKSSRINSGVFYVLSSASGITPSIFTVRRRPLCGNVISSSSLVDLSRIMICFQCLVAGRSPRPGIIACSRDNRLLGKSNTRIICLASNQNILRDPMGRKLNLGVMSVDELWLLHEEISQVLSVRLTSEKRELEKRLAQLRREKETSRPEPVDGQPSKAAPRARRKYPRVFPKYRNPNEPSETWSGRGKQPRWLAAALKTGRAIDEFVIRNAEPDRKDARQRRASQA